MSAAVHWPAPSAQAPTRRHRQDVPATCQICGTAIRRRYTISATRRWGTDSDLHVYWCRNCDAGFLLPRPSPELLESLYSSQYFVDHDTTKAVEPSARPSPGKSRMATRSQRAPRRCDSGNRQRRAGKGL